MTLQIGSQIYQGQARLRAAVGSEADGLEAAVNSALAMIRSTPEGSDLLRAIEGASHLVLIVKPEQNQSNTCVQSQQTEEACNVACYEEVLSANKLFAKIQQLLDKNMIQPGHPAIAKFQKFYVNSTYFANYKKLRGGSHAPAPIFLDTNLG